MSDKEMEVLETYLEKFRGKPDNPLNGKPISEILEEAISEVYQR